MRDAGHSMENIAEGTGMTKATVYRYLSGETKHGTYPTIKKVFDYATQVGVDKAEPDYAPTCGECGNPINPISENEKYTIEEFDSVGKDGTPLRIVLIKPAKPRETD